MSVYDEGQIEADVQAKGLTAPRVTAENLDSVITGAQYYVFPGTTTTVCCLLTRNGYTVTGESACASPGNFDEEIGQKIAYAEARSKLWALEGYLLAERLHRGTL
jgi:hypothetical protein